MLRLLVNGALERLDSEPDWSAWLELARQNAITLRLTEALQERSSSLLPETFSGAAARERDRAQAHLAVIRSLSAFCKRLDIAHLFLKVRRHYPDMGGDVDVLAERWGAAEHYALVRELGATPNPRTLAHRIAGAVTYRLVSLGTAVSLDVHHGRLGHCGEQRRLAEHLLRRREEFDLADQPISVPSMEDEVLLQGSQQVTGRRSFRLAEALFTLTACRNPRFDSTYLWSAARRLGIGSGLEGYLCYVDQICRHWLRGACLPLSGSSVACADEWGEVEFRSGTFRFPAIRAARRAYTAQLRADLQAGRWSSVGRLCFMPLVAATATVRKATA